MNSSTQPLIVSADPGSSKAWAVCFYPRLNASSNCVLKKYPIKDLSKLIDELLTHAKEGHVLLGIDAPIKAFGGVQRPTKFKPDGYEESGKYWPFNVNPYSQRPCEKALSSRPEVKELDCTELTELAGGIAKTFGWSEPFSGNEKNKSFTSRHEGISVLGYMGAPHGPVVGAFLAKLEKGAAKKSCQVCYNPENHFFYGSKQEGRTDVITVVETHPAVSAGFYAHYSTGENDPFFLQRIPKYKGKRNRKGCQEIAEATKRLLASIGIKRIEISPESLDDDDVDTLLGLANLVELSEGKADLFGTVEDGYFLIPRNESGPCFRERWKEARNQIVSAAARE